MILECIDVKYQKGDSGIVTGVKNHVPNGAISGGYGTYRCVSPTVIVLKLRDENGHIHETDNIANDLRRCTGYTRLPSRFVTSFCMRIKGQKIDCKMENDMNGMVHLSIPLEKYV